MLTFHFVFSPTDGGEMVRFDELTNLSRVFHLSKYF
jgi:hypothetical protein